MRTTYLQGSVPRRRLSRRRVVAGLTATGAAALMAACSSDSNQKSGGPGSPGAQATTGQQQATQAAARDFFSSLPDNPPKTWDDKDIKTGGSLVRIFNRQVGLDYMSTTVTVVADMTTAVYSRLIRLSNRQGMKSVTTPELEEDLATKWEQPDKTTLIFTLAPNIKYHNLKPMNGRAFTVDDIKFSFNRGKTFQRTVYKSYYSTIQSIEDVGGGKVKLTLAEPYPGIQQLLAAMFMSIMPPEIGENPDTAQTTAVGTGSMMMVKNTPNVEWVYQKHPEFFKTDAQGRKRPYIDGYTLSVVNDPATVMALLESGRADFANTTAVPVNLDNAEDFAKRNPKAVLQRRQQAWNGTALVGHHNQAPWNDLRVRQAVARSLDRETVMKTLMRGQGIIPPFFPWPYLFEKVPTAKEMGANYTYDPMQAKQLLAAAGYPNGLDLDLHWYEAANNEQVLTLFKQTAAEAGVRFNLIKGADSAAHNQKLTAKSWTGLIYVLRALPFVDPSATMPYLLPGSPLNAGDVNDPELVALNTRMENALGDERKAIAKQIFDRMVAQQYEVPGPTPDQVYPMSARLKNWVETAWGASGGSGMGGIDQTWIG